MPEEDLSCQSKYYFKDILFGLEFWTLKEQSNHLLKKSSRRPKQKRSDLVVFLYKTCLFLKKAETLVNKGFHKIKDLVYEMAQMGFKPL